MPGVGGIGGNTDAVPPAHGVEGAADIQLDLLSRADIGHLFSGVALCVPVRAEMGRNDHHAEFDTASGISCQELIAHVRRVLCADHMPLLRMDHRVGGGVLLEEGVQRSFQHLGHGPQGVDRWIDLVVFDLAEHGGGDPGQTGHLPDRKSALQTNGLDFFPEMQFFQNNPPKI